MCAGRRSNNSLLKSLLPPEPHCDLTLPIVPTLDLWPPPSLWSLTWTTLIPKTYKYQTLSPSIAKAKWSWARTGTGGTTWQAPRSRPQDLPLGLTPHLLAPFHEKRESQMNWIFILSQDGGLRAQRGSRYSGPLTPAMTQPHF